VYKSLFKVILVATLLMSTSIALIALAAGPGRMALNSTSGQPLKAEIELVAVDNEDTFSLFAQIEKRADPQNIGSEFVSPQDNQAASTYGPVMQSDTLSIIALRVRPRGISLSQMLIALYNANPNAFIRGNMNLLKAGVTLHVPSASEIALISENDANSEVEVQTANWRSSYDSATSSLSEPTAKSTASYALAQAKGSDMTATVVDDFPVTGESLKEILRLPGSIQEGAGNGGNVDSQNRFRMLEEESIAKNLALEETNERIAILERNIENLRTLNNSALPQMPEPALELTPEAPAEEATPVEPIGSAGYVGVGLILLLLGVLLLLSIIAIVSIRNRRMEEGEADPLT